MSNNLTYDEWTALDYETALLHIRVRILEATADGLTDENEELGCYVFRLEADHDELAKALGELVYMLELPAVAGVVALLDGGYAALLSKAKMLLEERGDL